MSPLPVGRLCPVASAVRAALLPFLLLSLRAPADQPPAGCLFGLRLDDPPGLCNRVGRVLETLDERWDAAYLLQVLGERLYNPTLEGVDLSAPVEFFFMHPGTHAHPWVSRFGATRPEEVMAGFAGRGAEVIPLADGVFRLRKVPGLPSQDAYLLLRGTRAVLSLDHEAMEAFLVPGQEPEGVSSLPPAGLTAWVDVQACLTAYAEKLQVERERMKERMREALERAGLAAEEDIGRLQGQLDTAIEFLHQVGRATVDLRFGRGDARLILRVLPLSGSALEGLVKAHPRGTPESFARMVPGSPAFLVYSNLSGARAARGLLLGTLGMKSAQEALSAFLPRSTGTLAVGYLTGDRRAPLEVLLIQEGERAEGILEAFRNRPAQAFSLLPCEDEPGVDELVPREDVLGRATARLIHRLFGERIRVARRTVSGRSVLSVGPSPLRRLRQVAALAGRDRRTSPPAAALRRAVEEMGGSSNLLVYLSPQAVRGWIAWTASPPAGGRPGEAGLVSTIKLSRDGSLEARLLLSTGVLVEALRSRKAPPAGRRGLMRGIPPRASE